MARIRTIKPEFFRHEELQDLEAANPGMHTMLVFAGLWGHCDSKGRFEWRPRQLKLDVLPFLSFDMAETLRLLESVGLVKKYEVDGKTYGEVPSFEKHQRLSGKEATEGERFPENKQEATGKQWGSNGEIPESQEGKGREKEGKGIRAADASPVGDAGMSEKPEKFDAVAWLTARGVSKQHATEWLKVRKEKRAANTETAFEKVETEAEKAGLSLAAAIEIAVQKSWQGFMAKWLEKDPPDRMPDGSAPPKTGDRRLHPIHKTPERFIEGLGWALDATESELAA